MNEFARFFERLALFLGTSIARLQSLTRLQKVAVASAGPFLAIALSYTGHPVFAVLAFCASIGLFHLAVPSAPVLPAQSADNDAEQ